jgi:hypothetical protein
MISHISSGGFCILEAIKTTKPSRSLSCFFKEYNQAQMPNKLYSETQVSDLTLS